MAWRTTGFTVIAIGVLWIAVAHAQSSQKLRSGFDQPCNKTLRCKSQSWFACDNETEKCRCAKSDEMIYDPTREKCVAMIGERCKFGFDEDGEAEAWYERAECVLGSVCGPSGICSCRDGFYEDAKNNQCSPVKNNGQSCGSKYECNQDKFLNCIEGKCLCDPDNAVYNKGSFNSYYDHYGTVSVPNGICIGRVGTRCSMSSNPRKYCVRNSNCYPSSTGTCTCSSSYSETSDRLCGLGYDQICSDTNICSDKLRCSGFKENQRMQVKCKCPHPNYQTYDATKSKCRGLIGASCDPNDVSSCIDKAVCIERDNNFQCECDEGFIDTSVGKCQIAFGAQCTYVNQDTMRDTNTCDESANLQCKGGKCSCEDDSNIYEADRRKCLAPVGLRCQESNQCVSNAQCVKIIGEFWGRCSCQDGFAATKHHTCGIPVPMTVEDSTEDGNDYEPFDQNRTTINN